MTRWKKRLATGLGVVLVIFIALVGFYWWFFDSSQVPSNIADFHPVNFDARAETNFFYSIGDDLKNSNHVDPLAPTLLHGHIKNFLVSPDQEKIAVVANGLLLVVGKGEGESRRVTPVDSIYRESQPIGQRFFRDADFQWTSDSKSLYLIGDEFYKSQGSQLYSVKGELWKYDIQTGVLQPVLNPFPAYSYFFGGKSGIYYSVPTNSGDLYLKYFNGQSSTDIKSPDTFNINHDELGPGIGESPFYSFDISDYREAVLPSMGVGLTTDSSTKTQKLIIGTKPYVTLTEGIGFKGPYYCSEMLRSTFLPGNRYFLFNASYCGNYSGQLLIDVQNEQYERLPRDTVVYSTPNTKTYTGYRITVGGIVAR